MNKQHRWCFFLLFLLDFTVSVVRVWMTSLTFPVGLFSFILYRSPHTCMNFHKLTQMPHLGFHSLILIVFDKRVVSMHIFNHHNYFHCSLFLLLLCNRSWNIVLILILVCICVNRCCCCWCSWSSSIFFPLNSIHSESFAQNSQTCVLFYSLCSVF